MTTALALTKLLATYMVYEFRITKNFRQYQGLSKTHQHRKQICQPSSSSDICQSPLPTIENFDDLYSKPIRL